LAEISGGVYWPDEEMHMRLLITGASGQLGGYVLRELSGTATPVTAWCHRRGGNLFGFALQPVDLRQRDAVAAAFHKARPTAVLHFAGYPAIADCFRHPDTAWDINAQGTALLAQLAADAGARIVYTSTDLVFDGSRGNYDERDEAGPLSVYGRSKLAGEPAVLAASTGVVARVSLMFGPTLIGKPYFFDQQLQKMRAGQEVGWFEDEWRSPLALAAAAKALLALVTSDITGLIHLGGPQRLSRYDMGRAVAAAYRLDPALVQPIPQTSVSTPEPRPRDVSLNSRLWRSLFPQAWWPDVEEACRDA
jgi:dTDP-4-dehydrorhamnose reductase